MSVDPSDSSYMPSLVVVSVGESVSQLKEIKTVHIASSDSLVTLLEDMTEVRVTLKHCFVFVVKYTALSTSICDQALFCFCCFICVCFIFIFILFVSQTLPDPPPCNSFSNSQSESFPFSKRPVGVNSIFNDTQAKQAFPPRQGNFTVRLFHLCMGSRYVFAL